MILGGLVSLPGMQVENLPPIAPGRVTVQASYPGAGPEVVEQGITTLLEKQFNGLERLDFIRSVSSANGSAITLGFSGGDPELNQVNTQNEATVVARQLPEQVARQGVRVRRSSDDLLMVLSFSAPRDLYSATFLSGWVDQAVIDRLERVPGVGNVTLFGGSQLAFRLWLDPDLLRQRSLTIAEIRQELQRQNVLAALGQVGEAPAPSDQLTTIPLRMEGRLRTPEDFADLVVGTSPNGGVTLLRDVGRVELGKQAYDNLASNLAGDEVVAMGLFQRDGSNALEVSRAVSEALVELGPVFPPGVDYQLIVDEADNVRDSLNRTMASLRDAVALVLLVLLLGLGNSRLALISAIAVPVALIGSLMVLRLTDSSINTLTLFGMVLATGLVVDDAIVVSEDIGRRIENGHPPRQAAREAMRELGGAVIATSLVLIVVFLPVLSLGGSLGRLYAPIAIAISGAILFSTFNALTFTPVAASRLLHADRPEPAWLRRFIEPTQQALEALETPYARLLDRVMTRRWWVVCLLVAGLVLTAVTLQRKPTAFIPQEDSGQVRGAVILPDGMALEQTQQVMERLRAIVAEEPLVERANFYAGRSFGDSTPSRGSFFARLRPIADRSGAEESAAAVVERLNAAVRGGINDALVQISESPSVRGFSPEGGLEMDLLDTSAGRLSLGEFEAEARDFIRVANETGSFQRVSTRFSANAPLLQLTPDRMRMASLGVDLSTVVSTIGASFGSDYVNDSFEGDQVRRVIVQLEADSRRDADDLLALPVRSRSGALVPLSQLVKVDPQTGPTSISHSRLVRSISIRALPAEGVSSGQAMALLERLHRERGSTTTEIEWAGLAREEQQAGGGNLRVFALAILVMVLVLAGLYENFADPFIILVTVPLALLGAVLGLGLRGLPLDVYGQMGLLVLVSLAAKNGILIVEFANQRLAEGMALDPAIRGAAIARLRPILLTAISSLAGFLPLLFATGAGAASRISIGTVVFSGLLVATILSLLAVPVVYRIVKGAELGWRGGSG